MFLGDIKWKHWLEIGLKHSKTSQGKRMSDSTDWSLRSHKIFRLQRHKLKNTNNNKILCVSVYFRLRIENINIDRGMVMEPIVLTL